MYKRQNPILGEGFDAPFPWNEALQFPGAWDYGMIRQLLDELHTGELIPAQEVLENETTQIRMAQTTDGRYLLYLPHSTKAVSYTHLQYHIVVRLRIFNRFFRADNLGVRTIASADTGTEGSDAGCACVSQDHFYRNFVYVYLQFSCQYTSGTGR